MLHLIFGTAGSGKTYVAREKACEYARAGKPVIFIVPEQFSFRTEREMLARLGADFAKNVEVLSFTRLAQTVEELSGGAGGRRLDECGRAAIMSLALKACSDHTKMYRSERFVSHLLDAVKEFKLCAISPQQLAQAAQMAKTRVLRSKLEELSLIYGAYDALVAQKGLDPMDDLTRLIPQLEQTGYAKDKYVIIDSFNGYTGQEMNILYVLMKQAQLLEITMCADSLSSAEGEMGIFSGVQRTARALIAHAGEMGIEVSAPTVLTDTPRFKNKAIEALSKNVFRFDRSAMPHAEHSQAVTVYTARDTYDEADYAAREIRRLLREENYRCREIAIIARSEGDYASAVSRALERQNIPYYMDRCSSAQDSPLIRYVQTAFDFVLTGRRTEDILRMLKTGMLESVDQSEIALFENYCFTWNVTGKEIFLPFTRSPSGYSSSMSEEDERNLEIINRLRERVASLLGAFSDAVRSASGRDISAAVYNLLSDSGSDRCLAALCTGGMLDATEAQVQAQIWDLLMQVLNQLAIILDNDRVTVREYASLLTLMFAQTSVGAIPQGLDEVSFGAADRMRPDQPRAVFIVGATLGVFPAGASSSGVFTDSERQELHSMDMPVADGSERQLIEERLLACNALSSASERLYITWPSTAHGEPCTPSEIVAQTQEILPDCTSRSFLDVPDCTMIENADAAFGLYASGAFEDEKLSDALCTALDEREGFSSRLDALRRARAGSDMRIEDSALATELFGRRINVSASAAQTYFGCPFAYFCKYGMKLRKPQRASLDARNSGTLIHYVLEHMLTEYSGDNYNELIALCASDRLGEVIAQMLETYRTEQLCGEDSPAFLYLIERLSAFLCEMMHNIGAELEQSSFRPSCMEYAIGSHFPDEGQPVEEDNCMPSPQLELPDGGTVSISGKIDRVDTCTVNGERYVRVIDYKSGSKDFKIGSVLQGSDMQMALYLAVLRRFSQRYAQHRPGGILYCHTSAKSSLSVRGATDADVKKERASMMRYVGLLTDNLDVLHQMEADMQGVFIAPKCKGDGSLNGATAGSCVPEAFFDRLGDMMLELLVDMGTKLHSGHIDVKPTDGKTGACRFCDYADVCAYEESGQVARTEHMNIKEACVRMQGAGEEE